MPTNMEYNICMVFFKKKELHGLLPTRVNSRWEYFGRLHGSEQFCIGEEQFSKYWFISTNANRFAVEVWWFWRN